MASITNPEPHPNRREPKGMTLMDLVALVLGAALVASMRWWTLDAVGILSPVPAPSWYTVIVGLREFASKSCLALAPLILARSYRYRRLIRPSEFLGVTFGLGQLVLTARFWPILGILDHNGVVLSEQAHHTFYIGLVVLGGIAALGFVLGLRRLRGWLLSIFLMVACLGLHNGGQYLLQEGARSFAGPFRPAELSNVLTFFLIMSPMLFFHTIPTVAAIRGYRLRDQTPTWLEWTSFALGLISALSIRLSIIALFSIRGYPPGFWRSEAILASLVLIALLLSIPIVRRLGPAWDRASRIDYH